MRKSMYITTIITMIIILLTIFSTSAYATTYQPDIDIRDIKQQTDGFIKKGEATANDAISQDSMKKLSNGIYNVLLILGICIAVIIGAILGIRFIIEGAEGKAEVQKALMPYIAGCVVVFGAFTIWKIIVLVLQGI